MLSNAHPGHTEGTVRRRVKTDNGTEVLAVAIPVMIQQYNEFMGGVGSVDQLPTHPLANHPLLEDPVLPPP